MTTEEIIELIAKSRKMERRDFNHDSESDSTYGCMIAETDINTHMGEGIDGSTTQLIQALDQLTVTQIWEINKSLANTGIHLSLADSPGIKPDAPRPPRPR